MAVSENGWVEGWVAAGAGASRFGLAVMEAKRVLSWLKLEARSRREVSGWMWLP